VFQHYDSLRGNNFLQAKRTALKFGKLLGFEEKVRIEERDTPQQKNGFDCGMFVLAISEFLARLYVGGQYNDKQMKSVITPNYVSELRKHFKQLIISMNK